MAHQVKVSEVMLPRRNEYVRGSVKKDNLVRIAGAFTGASWPDGLPPIEVRRLSKAELAANAKRGKKAKEYKYAAVDGVHRTTIALATVNEKVREKFNGLLKERGLEPLPSRLKLTTIPANIVDMTVAEAEVEQLRTNLSHGLLLDKKHRDAWAKHLVTNRKYAVPALARLLHLTERSVYRMVKGSQTKTGPRKKPVKREGSNGNTTTAVPVAKWTAERFIGDLHRLHAELSGAGRAKEVVAAIRANHEKIAKWLDPLVETLTLTNEAKG